MLRLHASKFQGQQPPTPSQFNHMKNIFRVKEVIHSNLGGRYTAVCLSRDPTPDEIAQLRRYTRGDAKALAGLPIQRIYHNKNLIPIVGRNVLCRLLADDTTYSGAVNYGALGSGTTPFTNLSTELNAEVYRKLKADSDAGDNFAYIDWSIAAGDVADATYQEFGAFIDGAVGADTGQAFSLLVTGGWVKSGSMFISLKVTLS